MIRCGEKEEEVLSHQDNFDPFGFTLKSTDERIYRNQRTSSLFLHEKIVMQECPVQITICLTAFSVLTFTLRKKKQITKDYCHRSKSLFGKHEPNPA